MMGVHDFVQYLSQGLRSALAREACKRGLLTLLFSGNELETAGLA